MTTIENRGLDETLKAKKKAHEARINMSFVNLLYTICLLLPTRLKWDNVQHAFKVSIGEAKYTAIVDGGLLGPDEQLHV